MSEQLSARFDLLRDWLQLANSRADAEVALRRFASAHGFDWFTYLSLAGANSYGLSNYAPDWQEDYLLKDKAAVDPVIEASLRNRGSFSWSEDEWPFRLTKQHRKFLGEARAYGIKSGVSIPIVSAFGRRALFYLRFERSEGRPISGQSPTLGIDVRSVHRWIPSRAAG